MHVLKHLYVMCMHLYASIYSKRFDFWLHHLDTDQYNANVGRINTSHIYIYTQWTSQHSKTLGIVDSFWQSFPQFVFACVVWEKQHVETGVCRR